MGAPEQLLVYNFWVIGGTAESKTISLSKAPLDVIVNTLKTEVVQGTGQSIFRSELDPCGQYRRVATGWGSLDR